MYIRESGIRVSGIRVSGIRVSGIRESGIRVSGIRVSGIRVSGIRESYLNWGHPVIVVSHDIEIDFIRGKNLREIRRITIILAT